MIMSQLLIIDIQMDYKNWISDDLEDKIKKEATEYSSVIYLFDNLNGHDVYSQMPAEWLEDEAFYDTLNHLTKQYGFFRTFMDIGFEDEDIVNLGKFLIKHKLSDATEIYEHEDIKTIFLQEFNKSEMLNYSFESYSFYLPLELIADLEQLIQQNVVLSGGGRSACLKEISLLLTMMDIDHSIDEDLTYP